MGGLCQLCERVWVSRCEAPDTAAAAAAAGLGLSAAIGIHIADFPAAQGWWLPFEGTRSHREVSAWATCAGGPWQIRVAEMPGQIRVTVVVNNAIS